MGRPAHYSRDITMRCLSLLNNLMPAVTEGFRGDEKFDGPLTTTFVLAMATPIIVLPVERIYKPGVGIDGAADDRALNEGLKEGVKKVLDGKTKFSDAPFFMGDWRYVPDVAPFNIAREWSPDLLKSLSDAAAVKVAEEASAQSMMKYLRNALAHGGVTYLDKDGQQSHGQAAMLGLVSAKIRDHKVVSLDVLRISESDFIRFVMSWAQWIEKSGVAHALSEDRDLAA